ncbi:MAG: proline--tRNA ligase, partial [Acidobacteria bacterium]
SLQQDMYDRAKKHMDSHIFEIDSKEEFLKAMDETRGFILAYWCGSAECEAKIKEETTATIRVIPSDQPETKKPCVYCGGSGKLRVYFAKSY